MFVVCRSLLAKEWQLLNQQWPGAKTIPPDTLMKLFGLYALASVVLFSNEFLYLPAWQWIEPYFKGSSSIHFYQDLFWLYFISFAYVFPCYAFCKYYLGMRLCDMGVKIKGFGQYVWIYLLGYAVMLPLIIWASTFDSFQNTYPLSLSAEQSTQDFALWEISYAIQFMALEFFFRGVMLFTLVRFYGLKALPIMIIPYMMLHFYKPGLECFASIFAGFFLSWAALRTRSIVVGMLIHITVAWTMDGVALMQKDRLLLLLGGG